MKKLFIVSRLSSKGTKEDDSEDLASYTELGWEIYTSGLRAKEMMLRGEITKDDFVMTHPDRMFMYTGLGPTVIPFDNDYIQNFDGKVVDFTSELFQILDFYNFRTLSDSEILSLKYHNSKLSFSPERKFVCVVLRLRSHSQDRGGPINLWIDKMREFHESGYDVYCVGKGAEKFTPEYARNVSLEDYVGLISHDLCALSIGPSSGCMLLNHAFGKSETEILFFSDGTNLIDRGDGIGHLLIFGIQGNLNRQKTRYHSAR